MTIEQILTIPYVAFLIAFLLLLLAVKGLMRKQHISWGSKESSANQDDFDSPDYLQFFLPIVVFAVLVLVTLVLLLLGGTDRTLSLLYLGGGLCAVGLLFMK